MINLSKRRARIKRYRNSPKGKATALRYDQSEKGKRARRKQRTTYRKNNLAAIREKERIKSHRRYLARKALIENYKRTHPCACGETDIAALDFHHINPPEKNFGIAQDRTKGLVAIQDEIAKCETMCANCHRKGEAGRPRPEHAAFFPRILDRL